MTLEASALWLLTIGVHYVVQLGVLVRAMTRPDREPASRLAWVLVVMALPGVGVALYLLLGEVNPGRRLLARMNAIGAALPTAPQGATPARLPDRLRAVFGRAAVVNGFAPLAGNQASLTADSDDAIDRLIADIDAATATVHILVYIWLDDRNGRRLAEAVARAARRGVTCRCMVDALGSRAMLRSAPWAAMAAAGVRTGSAFATNLAPLRVLIGRIDIRNHRKLFVIDGRIAYVGSQNCADPGFAIKARFAPWVDILLRVEGPVAWQTQHLFVADWTAHTGEDIADVLAAAAPGTDPGDGGFAALVFGTGPLKTPNAMPNAVPDVVALALASAAREVVLTTPYFVPTAALIEAMRATALRGVAVSLILPARNDSRFVGLASRAAYAGLLRAGVRIFEYRPGLLHAKTLVVDDTLAMIGSANLDRRSFELNFENGLLIADRTVTGAIAARQAAYLADSTAVSPETVRGWGVVRRLIHNLAATISPVL